MQFSGYQVILAHAERYSCIAEDIGLAEQLCEMGIHLQINAGSILGGSGRRSKRFVHGLMDNDLVFCVGTDAHDSKYRKPCMKRAAGWVSAKYGEEYMRRIFFSNAKEMLKKINRDESE